MALHTDEQIDKMCAELAALWKQGASRHLRFCQLVYDATHGEDIFYLEDEDFLEQLRAFTKNYSSTAGGQPWKPAPPMNWWNSSAT